MLHDSPAVCLVYLYLSVCCMCMRMSDFMYAYSMYISHLSSAWM